MAFPFPQPAAAFSTFMHIRHSYIRLKDAERKLEELAANIFHQPRARMNKLSTGLNRLLFYFIRCAALRPMLLFTMEITSGDLPCSITWITIDGITRSTIRLLVLGRGCRFSPPRPNQCCGSESLCQ
jgi:hypothetical protein